MKEPNKCGRRYVAGEFLASILLVATSLFVVAESLRMPQRGPIPYVVSPGFTPFLLGLTLLLLSLRIFFDTTKEGGYRQIREWFWESLRNEEFRRLLSIVLLTGAYTLLLGRVPFLVATLVYFSSIFTYLRIGRLVYIAMYAFSFSIFVAYVLPRLFEMPLP